MIFSLYSSGNKKNESGMSINHIALSIFLKEKVVIDFEMSVKAVEMSAKAEKWRDRKYQHFQRDVL